MIHDVISAVVELTVVLVFGIKFDDIKDLLSITPDIDVDLHACFYLSILAVACAMLICFTSFMEYKTRTGNHNYVLV